MELRKQYREGMARFAAAVNIVTTDGPAGAAGFTASAVCSVTDDPPTVLVCLNRASQLHTVFQENGVFCVNTLASDQRQLAEVFSHRLGPSMLERFALPHWEKMKTGAPAVRDAVASFDCRIMQVQEVGTHFVLYGEVQEIRISNCTSVLLYLNRSYRELPL